MTIGEYLGFALLFGFLILYINLAFIGLFRTDLSWKTQLSRSTVWRNASIKQLRIMTGVLLLVGLLFSGFVFKQLGNGTFKWRGNPKTYGFSDFFK